MDWLQHLAISLGLGFAAAVLNCFSKNHGFSVDCIWEGVGCVGGAMGIYFAALRGSWPGMTQVPQDHPAVQQAKADNQAAKANAQAGGKDPFNG